MNEFSEMFNRIKVDEIISFMLYGVESGFECSPDHDAEIKTAFDKLFETLEDMFPSACRHDDRLCSAVTSYGVANSNAYFEIGFVMGFQMYKNMDKRFQNIEKPGTASTMENLHIQTKDNLLNYLWGERIRGALEASLQQDEDFQKATRISNIEQDNLNIIGLSSEQTKAIDRVISANNAVGAEYGRVAYRQGFSDSLKLLSELQHLS